MAKKAYVNSRDVTRQIDDITNQLELGRVEAFLPQMDRRPMNGREMRVIEYLAAMDSKIVESGEALRDRLRDVPNGWRQWRLMASTLSRLLVQLYDLMPVKNLRHIQNICNHGEVLIRVRPASRVPEYMLVNEDDLRIMVNASMAAECAICLKDGKEIERCPLRRAMLNIAPPYDDPPTGCGYRDVALTSELGKYI